MAWQGVEGHDEVVELFRRAIARARLASTFLFVGPGGVGKRLFAERLAQALLCQRSPEAALAPCGLCDACVQVLSHTHPDLMIVEKPADKSFIPVEFFLGDRDHRMREGLCHDIGLKPFMGGRKVAIVDDADFLNEEGANALLKTLEEPPPGSVLILLGTSAERQLPTIRSRAQVIRFRPLAPEQVAEILVRTELAPEAAEAQRLAALSAGSIERALALGDAELWKFRDQLLATLARPQLESVPIAQAVGAFVDAAGKEAPPRRARARQVIAFASEFYRQVLRAQSGLEPGGDPPLVRAVGEAVAAGRVDAETAAACIERSLAALDHVDRNAHQATLIECWLDDLAQIVQTGQPVASWER
ncbi:MAG: ATP-binding protein [Pirellulales bacterium]